MFHVHRLAFLWIQISMKYPYSSNTRLKTLSNFSYLFHYRYSRTFWDFFLGCQKNNFGDTSAFFISIADFGWKIGKIMITFFRWSQVRNISHPFSFQTANKITRFKRNENSIHYTYINERKSFKSKFKQ